MPIPYKEIPRKCFFYRNLRIIILIPGSGLSLDQLADRPIV